jgi:hypothetical protein
MRAETIARAKTARESVERILLIELWRVQLF